MLLQKLCNIQAFLLVLFLIAPAWFLFPDSTHAVNSLLSVSGTVSLSVPAPAFGSKIDVWLQDADGYSSVSQTFTLQEGDTFFNYNFDTDLFTRGTVRYSCWSNCGDLYPSGYFTGIPGSYVSHDSANALILTGLGNTANMTIPFGRRVNGQVKLPGTDVAGVDIILEVTANAVNIWYSETDYVYIPSGGTAISYTLLLPPDDLEQWVVGYKITSGAQYNYYHTGYYVNDKPTTTINPQTTWDYDTAQKLYSNQSYNGIDMTIFRGNTITGTVSLPAGRVAPAGGLDILMWSRQLTYYNGKDEVVATISEGGTSAGYTLVMPVTYFNEAWEVQYSCAYYTYTKCLNEGYLDKGYYAGPSEPTFFVSRGYGLVGREDHVNIDLALIRANIISGTINLPAAAPSGGLTFSVYADDPVYPGALSDMSVTISAGSRSASYEVHFPENASLNWRVFYNMWESKKGYIERGYFATAGTTHLQSQATMLNGATNHYHIDMNAIPDKDNDGIPDSIDPVNNIMNPGILLLLRRTP